MVEEEIKGDLAIRIEAVVERTVGIVARDAEIALAGKVGVARGDDATVRLQREAGRANTQAAGGEVGQHFAVGVEGVVERAVRVIARN